MHVRNLCFLNRDSRQAWGLVGGHRNSRKMHSNLNSSIRACNVQCSYFHKKLILQPGLSHSSAWLLLCSHVSRLRSKLVVYNFMPRRPLAVFAYSKLIPCRSLVQVSNRVTWYVARMCSLVGDSKTFLLVRLLAHIIFVVVRASFGVFFPSVWLLTED